MRFILMGPPGAGKGTQAEKLAARFKIPRITTGDILRDAIRNETPVGRQAKRFLESGALVPDDVILGVMRERMEKPDARNGWILDGFPRTIQQAKGLERWIQGRGETIQMVIALEVDREVAVERLSARRQCTGCGRAYHLKFQPPSQNGLCDHCGGKLVQRADDEEATVRHRLQVYEEQTKPLIDFYKKRGLLQGVDGTQTPEKVFKRLSSLITSLK